MTSIPQKLALGGGAIVLAATLAFNVVQLAQNGSLAKTNKSLTDRIDNPVSGYVVRLTQARTNAEQCKTTINTQNFKIREMSTVSAATVANVQRRYDAEHVTRVRAESAAAAIIAVKPKGDTIAERISDVDAMILGDLK